MTLRVVLAFVLGMVVGDLPDDGIGWAAFKLAIAIAAFVVVIVVARREVQS
jgi:hypothetical protein